MKIFPNHRCNLLGIIFNTVTVQCNLIIGAPLERDLFFNQKNINDSKEREQSGKNEYG